MRESGQPATKTDSGGQRAPKSGGASTGTPREASEKGMPANKDPGKKPGS